MITIDEITNNGNVRSFVTTFQMMIRKNLPIYLLMTGLYENVSDLQNADGMTFLLRTPKIILSPLNKTGMIHAYMLSCEVSEEKAKEMADFTKGYAFAFQLLGYLFFREKQKDGNESLEILMPDFDQYMEEYVYTKIWTQLSPIDRTFFIAISRKEKYKVKDLLEDMGIENNKYSVYRTRLSQKGIIDISERGYVSMALPRFASIINNTQ